MLKPISYRSRFSLRTFVVLVALVAAGLGYVGREYQIVRDRREVTNELRHSNGSIKSLPVDGEFIIVIEEKARPPWLRRMLGDEGIRYWISSLANENARDRVLAVVPEAQVYRWSGTTTGGQWLPIDRTSSK